MSAPSRPAPAPPPKPQPPRLPTPDLPAVRQGMWRTMGTFTTCFLLFTLTSTPVSALPCNHCLKSTTITTNDARFNVGTFTAHGSDHAPTTPLRQELLVSFPTPPAVDRHRCHDPGYAGYPFGPTRAQSTTVKAGVTVLSLEGLGKRTACLPDPTGASMNGLRIGGAKPLMGSLPPKEVTEMDFGEGLSVGSGQGNEKVGLVQPNPNGGLYGGRWQGFSVSKRSPGAESQPQDDGNQKKDEADKTSPESTVDGNDRAPDNQASTKVESKAPASSGPGVEGSTTSPLPIWTPDVIATSLALIPVILSITIVCCLLLFMILHCCSPREITHVTNNTYTTKVVKRSPRDAEKPRPASEGPPGIDSGQEITPLQPAAVAPPDAQADGNLDQRTEPSPSSDLYIPHYPRQHSVISVDSGESAEKRWHRGLLDLGRRKNSTGQTFFLHPFVPSSLLSSSNSNVDTSYVLNQASKRLETVPPRPLSTVPASPLPSIPSPASLSPVSPALVSSEHSNTKTMLATGLRDTGCGTETLRNRRKGMRDNWLSSLFVEKAPGTENLVIFEQRDGAIRGASVGGAREPETVQVTECSSTPVRVFINVQDDQLRRHGSETKRPDIPTADGNHNQTNANNRGAQKTRDSAPRLRSVPQRLGEINSKVTTIPSTDLTVHEVQSPASGVEYHGCQTHSGCSDTSLPDEIPESTIGKVNFNTENAIFRRTSEETHVSRIDAGLRAPINHPKETMTIENSFLIPPAALDGIVDSTPIDTQAKFEEEFTKQLQEAVQQQEDEQQLSLMESLDGSANSPDGSGHGDIGLRWSERSATDCSEAQMNIGDRFESRLFVSTSSQGTSNNGDVRLTEERGSTTSLGVSTSF
ncbi:hypothetical protein K440DRAFT_636079 [Wilcoxina mikolae CBS 423.85]|nr:hypothetical protein K440DRAFT_636079 [Wilcoxina mikolae CBS 423.85]